MKNQKVLKEESVNFVPQQSSIEVERVSDNYPDNYSQGLNLDNEILVHDDIEEKEQITWVARLIEFIKLGWMYHLVTKCKYNVGDHNHLSFENKSEIKNHVMYHYGWNLLNLIARKNTKQTESVIQILDQGKRLSPCIARENVHIKKGQTLLKTTTNEWSSKIMKIKRNSDSSRKKGPVTPMNQ